MAVNYAQQLGLGKFDPTGRMQNYQRNAQNMRFNDQTMDIRALQQEQAELAAQKQQTVDANMGGALDGDPNAIREVFKNNPQLGQFFEQRQAKLVSEQGQQRANIINSKTVPFLMKLKNTPVEERGPLLQQALEDPDIDFDNKDAQEQVFAGDDQALDFALYGLMGDKAYTELNQPKETPEFQQGTGDMQGFAFNPATGEYSINENIKSRIDQAVNEPKKLDAKTRQSINKDITALTKETKMIANTTQSLEALSKITDEKGNISGPSSIAMVFKFMKALDPTSVVREGEFATAENSAGVDDKIRNTYNKLLEGGRLGKEQVNAFLRTAKGLANSAIEASSEEVNKYFDTYENELSDSFMEITKRRIPQKFKVESKKLNSSLLGREITEEEIKSTMKSRGVTRQEVLERLGVKQ